MQCIHRKKLQSTLRSFFYHLHTQPGCPFAVLKIDCDLMFACVEHNVRTENRPVARKRTLRRSVSALDGYRRLLSMLRYFPHPVSYPGITCFFVETPSTSTLSAAEAKRYSTR